MDNQNVSSLVGNETPQTKPTQAPDWYLGDQIEVTTPNETSISPNAEDTSIIPENNSGVGAEVSTIAIEQQSPVETQVATPPEPERVSQISPNQQINSILPVTKTTGENQEFVSTIGSDEKKVEKDFREGVQAAHAGKPN